MKGVAIDTGGGWVLCERTDESLLSGCSGQRVIVTNFDPAIDPAGPGSWMGVLTDDGRFALVGRDPLDTPTPEELAIADAYANLSVEGSTVDTRDLRLADVLLVGLGDQLIEERTPAQLTDAAGWVFTLEGFRERGGLFSALETLLESDDIEVVVGPHDLCGLPPQPISDRIEFASHLSLQPAGIDSCLQWFTVDLFLDDSGTVVAIILDLAVP